MIDDAPMMGAVSAVVRNKAMIHGAESWLAALPGLIESLEADWAITVGRSFDGGTEAFVAEAVCSDGTPAVLKILVPRSGDAARHEITVLELASGESCAALLRSDVERGALLAERLGRPMSELGLPLRRRHELLCGAASRLWRPAPDAGLPSGADKGRWLSEFIVEAWERTGRPCSNDVVRHALHCAKRRIAAHDDDEAVLVHGDVHQWNALEAGAGFKLIDPDGLLAEPEYDLGILMREDPLEGDLNERARWLAARTGLDADAIWEWGVVERVATGLLCVEIDLHPEGDDMLAAAERLAARWS